MIYGPKKNPDIRKGDYHLIVNDKTESIKCYNSAGKLHLFGGKHSTLPCIAKGRYGDSTWVWGGDTPPGLYRLGEIFISKPWESKAKIWFPYGKYCWDMVEQEGQENIRGRAGICLHGGGSTAPYPLAKYQKLTRTLGCIRMHNQHLEDYIFPLTHKRVLGFPVRRKNAVWLSVYQDKD